MDSIYRLKSSRSGDGGWWGERMEVLGLLP